MAIAVAAAVLPWHRSGQVRRTGFELARAADRAGLVTETWQQALLVTAFLLPLLAAVAFLAAVAGRSRWVGAASCASAAVGLASAGVVLRLSGGRQVGPGVTVLTAIAAGWCGLQLLGRRQAA